MSKFYSLISQKAETLFFVFSELVPIFSSAIALVLLVKLLLSVWNTSIKIPVSQLFFYSIMGVLVGYVENLSGARIGGLLPSAIVIIAFGINSYLKHQKGEVKEKTDPKVIFLSVSVSGISFLVSARYFALLFD